MNYAAHDKDESRIQLNLFNECESHPPTKRVLGGHSKYLKTAHGWIENHTVKRTRKSGATWEGEQSWLHWEEANGKKRSRYVPKSKLRAVQESVYELQRPIQETLKLLEKK
jgi:hypothetical protein